MIVRRKKWMRKTINVGDRVFATRLLPSPLHIQATSSISQRLAEAFKLNSQMAPTAHHIPEYLREFDSVFSKESFDVLPESKKWDHAIELIPGEKASNCKVYLLAPVEQKELDAFLKENLETGCVMNNPPPLHISFLSLSFLCLVTHYGLPLVYNHLL